MTPTCAVDQRHRDSLFGLHTTVFTVLVLCHALMAVLVRYPTVVYDELVYAGFARFFSGAAASRVFPGPWPPIASPARPQRPYKAERSRLM